MEHASRRMLHVNATAHPSAAWTLQQLREAIASDHAYRFIIHDRDEIFSAEFDASAAGLGLEVIKTPVRSPKANSLCERLIGTLRRECLELDYPVDRAASAEDSDVVVVPLQPRPATLLLGARPSRSTAKFPRAYATPSASFRPAKPNCGSLRPERTASRVRPLASRCMSVVRPLRTTMWRDSLEEQ